MKLMGKLFFPHTSAETNTYRNKEMTVITWITNMKNMQKYANYTSSREGRLPDLLYKF